MVDVVSSAGSWPDVDGADDLSFVIHVSNIHACTAGQVLQPGNLTVLPDKATALTIRSLAHPQHLAGVIDGDHGCVIDSQVGGGPVLRDGGPLHPVDDLKSGDLAGCVHGDRIEACAEILDLVAGAVGR